VTSIGSGHADFQDRPLQDPLLVGLVFMGAGFYLLSTFDVKHNESNRNRAMILIAWDSE